MNLFALQNYVNNLKKTKRQGWILRGIKSPESVADHSYSVALLSFVMAKELELDAEHCMSLALVHDLVESITKDITPHDNISQEDKIKMETDAVNKIGDDTNISLFKDLVIEYNNQQSPESKLVRDMDKLDMVFQALDYEKIHTENVDEFFSYVKDKLHFKESQEIYLEILNKRKNH